MVRAASRFIDEMGDAPGQWFINGLSQTGPRFSERTGLGGPRGTFVEREQRLLRYSVSSSLCRMNGRTYVRANGEADVQVWAQVHDGDDGWLNNSVYNEDRTQNLTYRILMPVHYDWNSFRLRIDIAGPASVIARGPVAELWETWEEEILLSMRRTTPFEHELSGMVEMFAVTRQEEWREAIKLALPGC